MWSLNARRASVSFELIGFSREANRSLQKEYWMLQMLGENIIYLICPVIVHRHMIITRWNKVSCRMIARGEDRNWQTMTVNRSEWVNDDTTGAWETPVAIRIPVTCVCRMHDAGAHGCSMYRMFHSLLLTWTCWIILEGPREKSCFREKF